MTWNLIKNANVWCFPHVFYRSMWSTRYLVRPRAPYPNRHDALISYYISTSKLSFLCY